MSEQDISNKLEEIERSIEALERRVEIHQSNSEQAHGTVRAEVGSLDRRQERLEAKMDSFFESIASLKDEVSKMNLNMVTYNAQLAEHIRRTAMAEQRLEKLEEQASKQKEHQAASHLEVEKMKVVGSTVFKVLIAISGIVGFIWTVIQIVDKLHK